MWIVTYGNRNLIGWSLPDSVSVHTKNFPWPPVVTPLWHMLRRIWSQTEGGSLSNSPNCVVDRASSIRDAWQSLGVSMFAGLGFIRRSPAHRYRGGGCNNRCWPSTKWIGRMLNLRLSPSARFLCLAALL